MGKHRKSRDWLLPLIPAVIVLLLAAVCLAFAAQGSVTHSKTAAPVPAYHGLTIPLVPQEQLQPVAEHTVASGENLWGIAWKFCGNGIKWKSLQQANKLSGVLKTGEVIRLVC